MKVLQANLIQALEVVRLELVLMLEDLEWIKVLIQLVHLDIILVLNLNKKALHLRRVREIRAIIHVMKD